MKCSIRGGEGTKRSADENSVSLLLLFCVSGVIQFPSFLFLHFAMSKADDCSAPYSDGPSWRGDSIGATENAGFSAKLQRNLGLDFVV